ncbi:TnsA endonuclease N-terminal domain-containing protein [Ferrovibrio sp.]|uniref:TnsA endonuclease N-terminal domain-containing protein n=1 Tax=Ferrovibrio sp. TaxID=1917215 RepID=UPI0035184CA1
MISMDGRRARKVILPSMPRCMSRFPSRKSGRTIYCESHLEQEFVTHLEFEDRVLRFREQPVTVQLQAAGKSLRYTPDFYVEQRNGNFLYEVKPAKRVSKYEAVFAAAANHFGQLGYQYRVVTDVDIKVEPLLSNRKILLRYRCHGIEEHKFDLVKRTLTSSGELSAEELGHMLDSDLPDIATIYSLLARGYLAADLAVAPITPDMLLTWA